MIKKNTKKIQLIPKKLTYKTKLSPQNSKNKWLSQSNCKTPKFYL